MASKHLPLPDQCPPPESIGRKGKFYRLGEPRHTVDEELASGSWRKPYKTSGPMQGRSDVCTAHALSLFDDLDALLNARKLSLWLRTKSIAVVDLEPADGLTLPSKSDLCEGHYDLWPTPIDSYPRGIVIEEGVIA